MNTIDELALEAQQTIEEVRHTKVMQRFFNLVMLLAIGALFLIVVHGETTQNARLISYEKTLERLCGQVYQGSLTYEDLNNCGVINHAGHEQ